MTDRSPNSRSVTAPNAWPSGRSRAAQLDADDAGRRSRPRAPASAADHARGAPTTGWRAPRSRRGCVARNIAASSVSDRLFDVETLHDVAADADEQQRERERPRVPLAAAHAAREEQQSDAGERDEHGRGFGHLDRREPPQRAEAARDRQRHRRREVDHARERDRGRRDPPGAAAQRGRVAGRRPGDGARMPRRRPSGGHDGRTRSRAAMRSSHVERREVAHAVPEPGVQLGARLELDPRAPQPLDEHGREAGRGRGRTPTTRPPLPQFA